LIDIIIDIIKTPFVVVVLALTALVGLGYLYKTGTFSEALSAIGGLFVRAHRDIGYNEPWETVVQDWKPTGYIDLSAPHEVCGDIGQKEPGLFHLNVEEHRLIKTIGGAAAVERRWRRASLAEAREAAANYYVFLQEHPEKAWSDDPRKSAALIKVQALGSTR
jgi:hypothetical protein